MSQIAGQPNRGLGRVESAKASRWEQVGALEESRELDSVEQKEQDREKGLDSNRGTEEARTKAGAK